MQTVSRTERGEAIKEQQTKRGPFDRATHPVRRRIAARNPGVSDEGEIESERDRDTHLAGSEAEVKLKAKRGNVAPR